MKAKFVNEALRDVLKPREVKDFEEVFKTKSYEEIEDLSDNIPDEELIEDMKRELNQMYIDMEADAPETDDEANEWGKSLNELENKIEIAQKQRKLVDEYLEKAKDIQNADYDMYKDLLAAKVNYEILDTTEWIDGEVFMDVIIDGDELEFKIDGLYVSLVDFEGDVDFGKFTRTWGQNIRLNKNNKYTIISDEPTKNESFIERIKEYVKLDRAELADFLNKYR